MGFGAVLGLGYMIYFCGVKKKKRRLFNELKGFMAEFDLSCAL